MTFTKTGLTRKRRTVKTVNGGSKTRSRTSKSTFSTQDKTRIKGMIAAEDKVIKVFKETSTLLKRVFRYPAVRLVMQEPEVKAGITDIRRILKVIPRRRKELAMLLAG